MGPNYAEIVMGPAETAVAADTEKDWYYRFPHPGKWQVKSVYWVPNDAVTANGTNYAVMTLTNVTQTQTIATRSWAATNSVAGTAEQQTTPTGLAGVVAQGDTLKLAKTDPGTGLAIRGQFVVELERLPLP